MLRHFEKPFAPPDANNPYPVFIDAINNSKRWKDDFPQVGNAKLRYDATTLREVGKPLNF